MKLQRAKLLTCIVPHGRGQGLLERLKRERGIVSAYVHHARGLGRSTPRGRRAVGGVHERDVLQAVVPEERAQEIFEYLYFESGVTEPHGGLMYVRPLLRSVPFELPDLPEEV